MGDTDQPLTSTALPLVGSRPFGATARVVVDLIAQAWLTRSWLVLVLLVVSIVGAASLVVGQNVIPLAVYPAL